MPVSWWLVVGAWGQPASCPERIPVAQVDDWLDEAEQAFADLDIERFLARSDQVRAALPCVDRVVPTPVAARLHRTEGLRRFGERKVDSVRAFAAARALEPGHTFDPRLVPPGNPILDDYNAMDLSAADPEELPAPGRGVLLYVDGVRTRERARAWPAVFQVVAPSGEPRTTALVQHHQPVPSYPIRREARPARVGLGIATGAAAVTSGVALRAAWLAHDAWSDPAATPDRLSTLRARTNTMSVVSAAGAVCAAGLATALVVTW